jgi:hypothetical protein
MVFGPGNPRDRRSRGFPGHRPSRVCFCSLRNHTNVVLYLSHATKTTEKQLLIPEFHTPSSPIRMKLRRRSYDIMSACPTIRMTSLMIPTTLTQQRKSVLHVCCSLIFLYHARIPRLDRRTPRVKFC